jgi:NAD(P)H-hydrate epimerase
MIARLIKRRVRDSHKGDYGKVMIITGSPGMTGAGCLAAEAALRAGAGLVYLAVPAGLSHVYETAVKEAVTLGLGGDANVYFGVDEAAKALAAAGKMDAVAIGPGLSTKEGVVEAVAKIFAGCAADCAVDGVAEEIAEILVGSASVGSRFRGTLVIDADALNAIAKDLSVLAKAKAPTVLTPHVGEMERLAGISAEEINKNRLQAAEDFAKKHSIVLVLKGRRTVVALPDGRKYINPTGNPGMATAGSGDVLTGIITALAAGGLDAGEAAIAAVYLHGLAGDFASAQLGEASVIAGDIVNHIASAFKHICKYTHIECSAKV